jgi:nitrous oxide reductase accessory protein NosL
MKKSMFFAVICFLVTGAFAAVTTFEAPKSCVSCGMDRTVFAQSRCVVAYEDGTASGTCSIHCAVEEMHRHKGKRVATLKVADYRSKELIDAKGAIWVLGGKKMGVMTSPAKWAFAREADAKTFVRENGGSVTPFAQIMREVREEVEQMDKKPEMD